jgi:tellurite resistance protein TerC
MGLRSLYFAVSGVMELFRFLKIGLALVLTFVGVKMCSSGFLEIPVVYSLGIIVSILLVSVLASMAIKKKEEINKHSTLE